MARVIAVANQKGGVGKTTTTVNLGTAMADLGRRVLLVDLDPQGHATLAMGIDPDGQEHTVYHLLTSELPLHAVVLRAHAGVDVAPASLDLAAAEMHLLSAPGRDTRLRLKLADADYDIVLVDCPPSLSLLTLNALVAAGEVLVPVQSQYHSYVGFAQLLETIKSVKSYANRDLEVTGVVVTQFDGRTRFHRETVEHLRSDLGVRYRIFDTVIPQGIRAQEAALAAVPVVRYDPRSNVAMAYLALARELAEEPVVVEASAAQEPTGRAASARERVGA